MSIYYILWVLFNENKDALLHLPSEVKGIIIVAVIICLLSGLIAKIEKLITIALFAAIIYFLATTFGFI